MVGSSQILQLMMIMMMKRNHEKKKEKKKAEMIVMVLVLGRLNRDMFPWIIFCNLLAKGRD